MVVEVRNRSKFLKKNTIFLNFNVLGIGKAIALRCAKDGANIILAAKTAEPHPKLPGTIYTAAKESKHFIDYNSYKV